MTVRYDRKGQVFFAHPDWVLVEYDPDGSNQHRFDGTVSMTFGNSDIEQVDDVIYVAVYEGGNCLFFAHADGHGAGSLQQGERT